MSKGLLRKRRKNLFCLVEEIRKGLSRPFVENEDYFIVDSMPLEVCKWSRRFSTKVCKEDYETSPEKGYCASQGSWFYGYKLHGVCTVSSVFSSIEITKANVHDINYLQEVKQQLSDCVVLADKGSPNSLGDTCQPVGKRTYLNQSTSVWKHLPERISTIIANSLTFLERLAKELKHYSLNFVISL